MNWGDIRGYGDTSLDGMGIQTRGKSLYKTKKQTNKQMQKEEIKEKLITSELLNALHFSSI